MILHPFVGIPPDCARFRHHDKRATLGWERKGLNKKRNAKMKTILESKVPVEQPSTSHPGELVNVSGASQIALSGYDPVAFFTDAKPVNGSPFITAEYQGATYLFASEEHRKLFTEEPARYVPQFGGFCAYGVALGKLFPVDINTWQVRNGKLYLNLNAGILKEFNSDFAGNVAKADKNWPGLVKTGGT
jgi:YHS domain-containing protein